MSPESDFDGIVITGAKEHNLKNLSLKIPRNKITVITGLSGSGKSSLAFDTIYAEGQRRYVESLSAYARNFLDQMKKPDIESVTGLSPAIAIDQKSVSVNPRSTVGTITEVYDYTRLLYAKVGIPMCPVHHVPVSSQTPQQILEDILESAEFSSGNKRIYVLAPMAQNKKGEFLAEFQKWFKKGFVKVKIDGQFFDLETLTKLGKKLTKTKAHDVDLVVDQLVVGEKFKGRLAESLNSSFSMAEGRVVIESDTKFRKAYSIHSACPVCGFSFPPLDPKFFSFNSPMGACPSCNGLGTQDILEDIELEEGGETKVISNVSYRLRDQKSVKDEDAEDFEPEIRDCDACHGLRLKPESLSVQVLGKSIAELSSSSCIELREWLERAKFPTKQQVITDKIVLQMKLRLDYLIRVGCGYLSLSRSAYSLSGGEAQRIRLATQVGSGLIGVLYVMDEPSIGLHPKDHQKLLQIIGELRDRGNTILMVEHDEETIRFADYVIDIGPRAGRLGGEILAEGTPDEIANNPKSVTGRFLSGADKIEIPKKRRPGNGQFLKIEGATGHNLKDVDLTIPLGTLTVVTGVSGSGKSTLILDTLFKVLSNRLNRTSVVPSPYRDSEGLDKIDKVIEINQRPIGRTPRSTPATYVGLLPMIRDLYAQLPDSRLRGYEPGRFSFNVKGGRCEACMGHGRIRLEMHFLADVFVTCDTCGGRRYNRDTLNIKYDHKSIADILDMTVEEALPFFKNHSQISRKLETLHRVGLDYMTLGQSSTTLSGGEAQRIKLSKELSRRGTGKTLYILDEPTTGLHFADIKKLVELLQELVDQGNTLLVIEHNLDVMKCADHIIDLGPEGGSKGGEIIATGTPEQIAKSKSSVTGQFLRPCL